MCFLKVKCRLVFELLSLMERYGGPPHRNLAEVSCFELTWTKNPPTEVFPLNVWFFKRNEIITNLTINRITLFWIPGCLHIPSACFEPTLEVKILHHWSGKIVTFKCTAIELFWHSEQSESDILLKCSFYVPISWIRRHIHHWKLIGPLPYSG